MGHKTSIFDLPEQKLKANTDEYKSAKKLTFCTKFAEDPNWLFRTFGADKKKPLEIHWKVNFSPKIHWRQNLDQFS